jgi:hypothetical protein
VLRVGRRRGDDEADRRGPRGGDRGRRRRCHAVHPIEDLFLDGFSYVL